MTADIFFPEVEWYGATSGQRIRVKVGEKFRIALTAGASGTWATTNDPVFAVSEFGPGILDVEVKDQGKSEIQVQVNRAVVFYLDLEAYSQEAASLNPQASEPELK